MGFIRMEILLQNLYSIKGSCKVSHMLREGNAPTDYMVVWEDLKRLQLSTA